MFHAIPEILSAEEAAAICEEAATLRFADGKATAGRHAKLVKNNEQAAGSPELEAIFTKARNALTSHAGFMSAARPARFSRFLLARYQQGMEKEVAVIAHSCGVAEPRLLRREHCRIVQPNGQTALLSELFPDPLSG